MELKNEVRLLLVGRTGIGKSSVGNSILKREVFRRCVSSLSVTQECKRGETIKNGKKITVVDTPGLFHTTIKQDLVKRKFLSVWIYLLPDHMRSFMFFAFQDIRPKKSRHWLSSKTSLEMVFVNTVLYCSLPTIL